MSGDCGRIELEENGLRMWATVVRAGADAVVCVGGGDRPHVGCVVLATPSPSRSRPGRWTPSYSVLTIPPHKEEPIARTVAGRVTSELGCSTVVSAGVHDDGLDRDGIATYLRLGERMAEAVAAWLAGQETE
jgi:hypothetical protein